MKKIGTVFISIVFSLLSIASALAFVDQDGNWKASVNHFNISGSFDYFLYYDLDFSQVISKVSLPQNQNMILFETEYDFPDNPFFINFQYGETGLDTQGRGSDSDWTVYGLDTLTYYGTFDSYGGQQMLAIDLGMMLLKTNRQNVTIFFGWGKQETSNELRNVVYHLVDGVDVGNLSQPDNGSFLNGEFKGLRIGIADEVIFHPNLSLNMGVTFLSFRAKADGHWTNHNPAWDWVDTGRAVGYSVNAGLQYSFSSHFVSQIDYYYTYNQADGCVEVLDDMVLTEPVDLKYEQKGVWVRLSYLF